jgi:MerR family copper efflux transcriptional regulator
MMSALLIGEVAARAGLPTATIRYYESIGLLEPAARTASGYRRYSEHTITVLQFIKKAQGLGFSLEEVADILSMSRAGKAPCDDVLAIARRHVAALDERLRQLQAFRDQLASEVAKWEKRRTTITCDGLCEFIMDAEPLAPAPQITRRPSVRAAKSRSSA